MSWTFFRRNHHGLLGRGVGVALLSAVFTFVFAGFNSVSFAIANSGITYQGRILRPDGTVLEDSNVQFKMQIRSPDTNNCLMYEEVQSLDMTNSKGLFGLTMNDGNGAVTPLLIQDGAAAPAQLAIERVFSNRGTLTFSAGKCASGTVYIPNSGDARRLVVYFKDSTMASWEQMPTQMINYVPYAFQAKEVQGFGIQSLVRVQEADGTMDSVSPLSNANYTELLALIGGTSTQYEKLNQVRGVTVPAMGNNQYLQWSGGAWVSADPVAGVQSFAKTALPVCAGGDFLRDNGSGGLVCATPGGGGGGTVTSIATGVGLTGGPITASGTIALATIGSGGTGFKVTYDIYGRVTGAVALVEADIPTLVTAGKVSGNAIASGTIGGSTAINTTGAISTTALISTTNNINANTANVTNVVASGTVSAVTVSGRTVQLFNPTGTANKITMTADPALSADYTLTWPLTAGGAGQVLTTNGAGLLTWSAVGSGSSITSLTGDVVTVGSGAAAATIQPGAVTSGKIAVGGVASSNLAAGAVTSTAIAAQSVTYSKIQNVASQSLLGNPSGVSGSVQEISIGSGLQLSASGQLSATLTGVSGSATLNNGKIWIGDGTNKAQEKTLVGDVTISSTGSATVAFVGGSIASAVNAATILANAATALSTNNALVLRDGTGNFAANVATLNGLSLNNAGSIVTLTNPIGANYSMSLPTNLGSNGQVLTTNGAGITTWTTAVTSATGFVQGGNTFGASAVLGTNDANALQFRTNGTNQVTIASSGYVGIGTTAPLNTLDVNGAAAFGTYAGTATSANNAIFGGGRVGIGISGPGFPLDVEATYGPIVGINATNNAVQAMSVKGTSTFDTGQVGQSAISAFGRVGQTAPIFQVGALSSSPGSYLQVTNNGNVGLGNTSPTSRLSVNGSMSLANGSGNVGFIASSTAGTANYTWPTSVAGGNFLQTDASGNLSWASVGGGGDFFKNGSVAMTGAFVAQPGTVAAPGMTFTGNTNTGYFQPASNTLGFSIAGAEKVRIDASGNVGIGTTNPGATLAVSGNTIVNGTSANAFAVGPNGATNPTFQIDTSSASAANGVKLTSSAQGSGIVLQGISSGANDSLTIRSVGGGALNLGPPGGGGVNIQNNGSTIESISTTGAQINFTPSANSGATTHYSFSGAADTGLNAGNNLPDVYFNLGQTRQHQTGALPLQEDFRISPTTHSFAGASVLTDAATFAVDSAPSAGGNATLTNSHAIYVPPTAIVGSVMNSYALTVNAATGATNNYAAQFLGGNVGIGTSNPGSRLAVNGSMSLANGSGNVGFIASSSAGTANYTWPTSVAGGNFLQTDASGNLSWASVGGGGDFFKNGSVAMTGALVHQPGTAAAPGLTFVGDTSTGVFQPASSAVAVSIAGSEKMRVNASGYVGIGTTSPSYLMDVNGNMIVRNQLLAVDNTTMLGTGSNRFNVGYFGDGGLRVSGSNASSLAQFTQLSTGPVATFMGGNVGIGTTTPAAQLHLYGAPTASNPQLFELWSNPTFASLSESAMHIDTNVAPASAPGSSATSVGIGINHWSSSANLNSNVSMVGIQSYAQPAVPVGATMANAIGVQGIGKNGGVGTLSGATGGSFTASNGSTGTITNGYGIYVRNNNASTGTITNSHGLYVDSPLNASGTIGTSTGVYIATQTAGSTNYALYSQGGNNYFGGSVGVGTTAPSAKLSVNGSMSLANGSGNVGFIASNAAGTANYTWPTSVAGGNFLQTDASGNLSWASVGGGGDFFKNGSVNMTGAFVAQPGTASAPGLTFVGDTSTGVFQPASSAVAVSIAGSEKMRINASGNVGIGTNAPSVSLDVSGQIKTPQGSGGGYLFPAFSAATQGIFSNSGSNDISISPFYDGLFAPSNSTGRFRPSNDNASGLGTPGQRWAYLFVGTGNSSFAGNVGVGTTTPTSKLSVNGSMSLANGSGNVGFIASSSAGTANYTWPTAVAGGNFLQTDASGNLSWASIGGGGDFFKNGSVAMTGALVHQPGTAAAPGLTFVGDTSTGVFQPASSAVAVSIAGSEKMRINASGYVGIGTTAPNTELDVNLATNTTTDIFDVSYVGTPFFKIARDSASGYNNLVSTARSHNFGALQPTDWTTTTMFVKSPSTTSKTLALEKTPGQSADLMQIRNSGATTGDLVTVNASGYLGVGVVSPTAYIDVSGNVPAAGASLRVTSTATNSNAVESLVNAGAVTAPSSAPGSAYESSAIRGNNWTNSANLNANTSVIGMYGIVQNNNNSTPQNLYGVWGRASGAATNTSAVAGAIQVSGNTGTGSIFSGFLQNTGSGTVSSANGVNVSVSNTSTGTITNGYGVNIGAPGNSGGGGFSNYYGVYISTPTVASSNYAFYSQGGDNYFGGNVGIGMTPAASAVLSAKGAVRLYGATSGYNGFVASAVAGSTVWTLPVNDGTNGQVLTTNGAGQLAWTTAGGGSGDFKADGSVNMTGTLKHIAGTVAAPGSTFVGDTSTGFFQPASSTVGVAVGGAEKLRVNASGYVGVGTSSPSSLLDVAGAVNVAYGTSAAPSLGFENDTGTGFYHTASGITGYSSLGVAKFTMSTGLTSTSNFGFQVNTGAGSAAAPTFTFHGEAVSGMWQPSFGNIAFSASGVEVVRMTASGNVGIGTITPAAKLSVNGSMVVMGSTSGYNGFVASAVAGSTVWTLPVNDGTSGQVLTTNGSGQLAWTTAGGGSGDFMKNGSVNMTGNFVAQPGTAASPGVTFVGDTTTGTFQPASSNLGWSVAGAEKMRINASGYVGIGTTSPTYGLEVKVVASGTVSSFAARANPGATGSTYYNSVLFDNLYGAGNFKNQFIMASNGTPKWALGNDVTGLGVQNFFIWDGAANNNRLLIDAAGAVQTGASGVFGFASNVDPKNASLDTGMSRIGVATMAIGNGTNGNTTGTLIAGKVGIGTSSPAARLSVNGSMVVMGSTSGYSGFVASAVAGSTIWTLPTADGTNGQVLTTNGSGVLTWTTASGGVSTTTTSAASPVDLNALTASVLDWNLGAQTNVVFNVKNMVNGVTYTAALRGSASGTTTVNCYSDGGSTALTPTFLPANSTRAGSASMYSIQRVGSYCYITWSTGWN